MAKQKADLTIEEQSQNLAQMFSLAFWLTAAWLFASVSYVPLKRFGAALVTPEADAVAAVFAFADVLIAQIAVVFAMAALYTARGLFFQFAEGAIFIPQNGATLARMGDWLIASAVAALVMPFVLAGAAQRTQGDISGLYLAIVLALIGLAIRLFGRIWTLAAEIKADNDQVV